MQFKFNPHSKRQQRYGRLAVGTLGVLVYLTMVACSDGGGRHAQVGGEDELTSPPQTAIPAQPASVEVASTPEPPRPVTFEEAETAYREKRFGEAVSLFRTYTSDRPGNPWGYYMLGLSAWKSGQLDDAEVAFERALEGDPEHVKSLVNLSRVLLEQDRPAEALTKVEEVLTRDPESNDGYRVLGRARYEIGDVESAIEAYRKAIVANDHDAWSMNNLGLIFIRQERFEDALPPLARATELRDDVAVFFNNLGVALERTGDFGKAIEAYKTALIVDEHYDKASVSLARLEEQQDDSVVSVDLQAVGQRFVEQIEEWRASFGGAWVPHEEEVEADTTVIPGSIPEAIDDKTPEETKPDSTIGERPDAVETGR